MANAGLEVIDVPFTTMKNLTDYLGHPCYDSRSIAQLSAKEGISRYRGSPNAAHPTSMGFLHSHATTVGDAKQAIGYIPMKTDHVDAYFKADGEIR